MFDRRTLTAICGDFKNCCLCQLLQKLDIKLLG